ncbi:MAG: tetratricopeptide repeat protein [Opitutaceae bacterium]|nr:tetratricopeptide repeat protein [Opitutaceae bacterium]
MSVRFRILSILISLATGGTLHAISLPEAQELYRARRYVEAQAAFEQLIAAEPGNAEAAYRLGRLALLRDDPATAVKWLEKATALTPQSSSYFKSLGDAYGLSAQEAGLFSKPGFARKSLAAYQKGVELDPQSVSAREALYTFHRQAPAIAGGGAAKARTEALEIQKLNAVRGTVLLVDLGVAEEKYQEAFDALENLRRTHPESLAALYQIGRVAALSGLRLEQGEAALKECLAHTPDETQAPLWAARWRLGQIFEKKGDPASARAEYAAALKLNPDQPQLIEARERVK